MKKWILLIFSIFIFVTGALAYDDSDVVTVEISPLYTEISFSTVTLDGFDWVTCPTVALRGRKEINIFNTSATLNVYLTGTSGSTVTRRLLPQTDITLKASSNMNIYVSASTAGAVVEFIEIK